TWDCSPVPARFNSCLTPTTRTSRIRPAKLRIQLPTAIGFRQLSRMVGWTFELESRPETWCSKAALAVSKEQVEELQSWSSRTSSQAPTRSPWLETSITNSVIPFDQGEGNTPSTKEMKP